MRTARSSRPRFLTNSSEATTTAAEPSDVGLSIAHVDNYVAITNVEIRDRSTVHYPKVINIISLLVIAIIIKCQTTILYG